MIALMTERSGVDSRTKALAQFVFAVVVWGSIGVFVRYIPLSSGEEAPTLNVAHLTLRPRSTVPGTM